MAGRPRKVKTEEKKEEKKYANPCDQFFAESAEQISSQFGADVVSSAADEDKNLKYLEVPDLGMQWELGRMGFALGRILYAMGFEGAGKTSFSLWVANLAFQAGGFAAMIETEQAGSAEHMSAYLDDPKRFRIYHPDTIEDAMKMTLQTLNLFMKIDPKGEIPKVLILDSIAGSTDERSEEDEEDIAKPKVGGTAKLIKDYTNVIKGKLKQTNTLWVVLNQARDHIDTSGMGAKIPEIDKVVSTGGRAIPFAATYWAILKKQAAVKEAGEKAGFKVKFTLKKNKLRVPFKEVYYHVKFGESFDFIEETMKLLTISEIGGLKKGKNGYYSKDMGIAEADGLSMEDMYALIHTPEYKQVFQEELDIITDDTLLKYNAPKKKDEPTTRETGPEQQEEVLPESLPDSEDTE